MLSMPAFCAKAVPIAIKSIPAIKQKGQCDWSAAKWQPRRRHSVSQAAPLPLIILISGRGSNMAAIADACTTRALNARVSCVIADRPEAAGLKLAAARGLATQALDFREFAQREDFDTALSDLLAPHLRQERRCLVVLAGFMRILTAGLVQQLAGQMINIHPSLLPLYPGLNTHARALADGAQWHGASVHYVTPALDGGPVVAQTRVPVAAADTVASLSARVQRAEHRLYPMVLKLMAADRLRWQSGCPQFDGSPLTVPLRFEPPEEVLHG